MAGVTAFPVPFVDHIFLKGLSHGSYHAELQDHTGRTIAFMPYVATDAPLDLRMPIAKGSYLLKLGDGRSTHVMRVVKE
jgi:hypothetical protein